MVTQVIRGLPSWLEAGMDVSLLLADLHSFLVSYPGSYWKQQVFFDRTLDQEVIGSFSGGRHPNEDGEDCDPHAGEAARRGDPRVSQQDPRSPGQRAGALHKVDEHLKLRKLTTLFRKLLNSGVGDDAPASAANNNNGSSHNNAVASSEKKKMPRFAVEVF